MPDRIAQKMEVLAFTEQIADARIRYQVIQMKDSSFVWAQLVGSGQDGGSLRSLSVSMPSRTNASLPPATTAMPGRGAVISRGIAQKLTKRCGIPVYACIDLPEDVGGVLVESIVQRILRELKAGQTTSSREESS